MRNLPSPGRSHVREQLAEALASQGHGGYAASEAELDEVIALYDDYDAAGGAPRESLKGLNLAGALRQAIVEAYGLTQRGRRLASIRESVMQGVEQCPICGISPPSVLDHHLPKAEFHPLAIYVRNLVPLCVHCNQSKAASVPEKPAERFVHPYFDSLPNSRFLLATVTIHNGGLVAEFGVDPVAKLPELLRERLEHQLRRLRLNDRYAREINVYLVSHATALQMCFTEGGANAVREYLRAQAATEFARFHLNHWRPLLLLALGIHDGFCEGEFNDCL